MKAKDITKQRIADFLNERQTIHSRVWHLKFDNYATDVLRWLDKIGVTEKRGRRRVLKTDIATACIEILQSDEPLPDHSIRGRRKEDGKLICEMNHKTFYLVTYCPIDPEDREQRPFFRPHLARFTKTETKGDGVWFPEGIRFRYYENDVPMGMFEWRDNRMVAI